MVVDLHHVPGRLRVRISALKGERLGAGALRQELSSVEGVQSAWVNPCTGSVTLHYDRDCFQLEKLWARLRQLGYISQAPRPLESGDLLQKTETLASAAAQALVEAAVGAAIDHFLGRSAGALVRLLI